MARRVPMVTTGRQASVRITWPERVTTAGAFPAGESSFPSATEDQWAVARWAGIQRAVVRGNWPGLRVIQGATYDRGLAYRIALAALVFAVWESGWGRAEHNWNPWGLRCRDAAGHDATCFDATDASTGEAASWSAFPEFYESAHAFLARWFLPSPTSAAARALAQGDPRAYLFARAQGYTASCSQISGEDWARIVNRLTRAIRTGIAEGSADVTAALATLPEPRVRPLGGGVEGWEILDDPTWLSNVAPQGEIPLCPEGAGSDDGDGEGDGDGDATGAGGVILAVAAVGGLVWWSGKRASRAARKRERINTEAI